MTLRSIRPHPNATDAEQVQTLTSLGASPRYIASHLSLEEEELRQHYSLQLDLGTEEANLHVAEVFYRMATSGQHPQITMAWMKMRARWTETAPVSQSSPEEEEELRQQAKDKLLTLLNRGQNADSDPSAA